MLNFPKVSPKSVGILANSLDELPHSIRSSSMTPTDIKTGSDGQVATLQKVQWNNLMLFIYDRTQNVNAALDAMKSMNCDVVLGLHLVTKLREDILDHQVILPSDYVHLTSSIERRSTSDAFRKHIQRVLTQQNVSFLDSDTTVYVQSNSIKTNNVPSATELSFYSSFGDVLGHHAANEQQALESMNIPFISIALTSLFTNPQYDDHLGLKQSGNHPFQHVLTHVLNDFAGSTELPPALTPKGDVVDEIIFAKHVVPVNPMNVVHDNYAVVIHNGVIVDLLLWSQAYAKYCASKLTDKSRHIICPGLINAHTHASMTLFRGLADDKPLCEWLTEDIWPAEAKFVCKDFVTDGTEHSVAEMIRSGTTCYNDMYFFPEHSASALSKIGMRAVLGQIVLEFPTRYASNAAEYLALATTVHEKAIKDSPLLYSSMAPHAPYTVSDDSLLKIEAISKKNGWPIHMHVHETQAECDDSENLLSDSMSCHQSREACRPVQNLKRLGLLSNRLVAVHMTQLTNEEIEDVAAANVNIVHCPSSNLKLASGICRVTSLLEKGVNVAIGTDSACSNNSLNMFAEMKLAAVLAKAESKQCTSVPAAMALRMATLNGAIALGLQDQVGSIEVGKFADLIAVNVDCIELMPMYNVISHLVYAASRENVTDSWIHGKRVLNDRHLVTLDEQLARQHCSKWHDKIRDFHDSMGKAV